MSRSHLQQASVGTIMVSCSAFFSCLHDTLQLTLLSSVLLIPSIKLHCDLHLCLSSFTFHLAALSVCLLSCILCPYPVHMTLLSVSEFHHCCLCDQQVPYLCIYSLPRYIVTCNLCVKSFSLQYLPQALTPMFSWVFLMTLYFVLKNPEYASSSHSSFLSTLAKPMPQVHKNNLPIPHSPHATTTARDTLK